MTKEEFLRTYLADETFIEQGYLKPDEASNYRWATPTSVKLIEVLKEAIVGEQAGESISITERKINNYLNRQS